MWQSLQQDARDLPFTVLAIALDRPDAARPWIEAARPSYPCLVDRDHVVAELYGLVNVPQAAWIDEDGRVVRPPETAGSTDGFRAMDRKTFRMPAEVVAERQRVSAAYFAAVRDWALRGAESPHVLDEVSMAARLAPPDDAVANAYVHFRLGQALRREGLEDEASAELAEASRLHADSWAMWRQSAPKDARGLASGEAFWRRVDALGERPYYAPIDSAIVPPKG